MTNEMKLLMALCDALGFEVERETIYTVDGKPLESDVAFNLISAGDVSKIDSEASYKLIKKAGDGKKQSPMQDKIDEARAVDWHQAMYGEAIFSGSAEYWAEALKKVTL